MQRYALWLALCAATVVPGLVWVAAAPGSASGVAKASPSRPAGLTRGQRRRADKLISQFENSTSKIQYC